MKRSQHYRTYKGYPIILLDLGPAKGLFPVLALNHVRAIVKAAKRQLSSQEANGT